jgi:hypothetical protein
MFAAFSPMLNAPAKDKFYPAKDYCGSGKNGKMLADVRRCEI